MRNILSIFLLLFSFLLSAENIILYPSSDNYTDVEHPGTANVITELWTANFIPAGNFQRINIDFEISEYLNHNFQGAELNLTRFFSCPSTGSTLVKVYPITQAWDESNCNIHQHLSYNENINAQFHLSGTPGSSIQQFTLDVTSIMQEVIDAELGFHGLVMIAEENQKFSKFYSKEHSYFAYRPSLDLTSSPVSNENAETFTTSLNITAFPNPFNPITTIEFDNPQEEKAEVAIYNIRGRLVKRVRGVKVNAGINKVTWNGYDESNKEVSSGIYFCKVKVGNQVATKKIVLQK